MQDLEAMMAMTTIVQNMRTLGGMAKETIVFDLEQAKAALEIAEGDDVTPKDDVVENESDRASALYHVFAHEYFHVYQRAPMLDKNTSKEIPAWWIEGGAHYFQYLWMIENQVNFDKLTQKSRFVISNLIWVNVQYQCLNKAIIPLRKCSIIRYIIGICKVKKYRFMS